MFQDGILNIFPERGLDQSILVAVLIGIYVLLFFTEVFGWVWAGLVVPGYLASVYAVQPAAGVAISVEAVLTFGASRLISDVLSRTGGWSPFFGRERFFLIVLLSVVVRQASELWLIDDLLGWIDGIAGTSYATAHDFSSIGLVLVPLLANMFWKLTLPRGLFQVGTCVALTWAAVALVLLPYTNLSFSSFELTYEDVALDFLGSPKAYIILLTTAFLAAYANLAYGWDYNGILVPSLLALSWFEPFTLAVTVVEMLLLLYATRGVLALPVIRQMNLEGPRKVTVVFTVGFLMKLAAGWAIGDRWPELKLTDLFGFGYVLTSLVAVKMLNTKKIGRVLLPSIFISLIGFALGSGIGFALEVIAPREPARLPVGAAAGATSERLMATPAGAMAAATVRARPELPRARHGRPTAELIDYADLWRDLDTWIADGVVDPERIAGKAAALGLALRPLAGGAPGTRDGWVLYEAEERLQVQVGWETAVLYPGAPGPVIEVPRPRRERPAAEAATILCERLACRAIIASGSDGVDTTSAADPLGHPRSTFHTVHRQLRRSPVLQVRADERVAAGTPALHLRHTIPDALRLPALWDSELALTWDPPPGVDLPWRRGSDLAVLRIHPDDLWAVLAASGEPPRDLGAGTVARWVTQWMATPPASAPSEPASPTELRVLEELLVTRMVARDPARAPWLAALARSIDHQLGWLPDGVAPGQGAWVLAGHGRPGWLAVAVASGEVEPFVLEVPKPRTETGAGRLAAEAWIVGRGLALVLDAEQPGGLDPTMPGNVATPFQAAHQALTRAVADDPDAAIVQVRGFAAWRPTREELVISLGTPLLDPARAPAAVARLVAPDGALGRLTASRRWADGAADVADLHGTGSPQLLYAHALIGPPFAMVWFAEHVRARAAPVGEADEVQVRAARFGVGFVEAPLADLLLAPGLAAPPPGGPAIDARSAALIALAAEYAETGDVAALAELAARAPRGAVRLGWSPDLRIAFVVVELTSGATRIRAAALAGSGWGADCPPIAAGPAAQQAVWQALQARCPRMVVYGGRP